MGCSKVPGGRDPRATSFDSLVARLFAFVACFLRVASISQS